MSESLPPEAEISNRLAARRDTAAQLRARSGRISHARVLAFAATTGLGFAAWFGSVPLWFVAGFGLGFVTLVVWHDRVIRQQVKATSAIQHYERIAARIAGTWQGLGDVRTDRSSPEHGYAADLDLFGPGGLFDRISLPSTDAGSRTLATWMGSPATGEQIRARQRCVSALRSEHDLREDLAVLLPQVRDAIDARALVDWGEAGATFDRAQTTKMRAAVWWATISTISASVVWGVTDVGPLPLICVAAVVAVMDRRWRGIVNTVAGGVGRRAGSLRSLANVIDRIAAHSASESELHGYTQRLRGEGGTPAGEAVRALQRSCAWLEARENQLFAPIAFLVLWSVGFSLAIEQWRRRHGPRLRDWIEAVGEFEAVLATAEYAYECPRDAIPEIVEGAALFEASGLGHPLLDDAECVRNDVALGDPIRVLIVSGSNMSGKSTLLRSVGIAVVLARIGAPVRAERLRMAALEIGATLRVQDSLQKGSSRFYAELERLRAITEISRSGRPLLFLLDEVFHGTNSHDRLVGAEAIIRNLVGAGSVGLVTTHDLALARAADGIGPSARNVHFRDQLVDGQLHFDYRMREGVVDHSNALALMRAVGLDV